MYLDISLIALTALKFSLSGSILINLQPSFCPTAIFFFFFFFSQYFCHYDHYQLLLQVYSYENVNKYYKPKHYFVFTPYLFSPSNELIICASTDCSFVKIVSYCSNPNLVLNLCANVVLQSIILSLKSLLGLLFLVHQLVYIYGFMVSKKFYCNFLKIFMI